MPRNQNIFKNSQDFIAANLLSEERQRKFVCTNKEEKVKGSIQFKEEKSVISIAGQLQFSGSTNAVIIANSDYIKKDDIENNQVCNNIIKMFL